MKPKKNKHIESTAIIEKSDDGWYVGQLEEKIHPQETEICLMKRAKFFNLRFTII